MSIKIAQLRPEGVDAAIEFAKTVGCELNPQDVHSSISLIAREGETIVASVMGVHRPGGACELHVCLSKLDDPGKLTGELLNKTLMKVHGAGARRCQIHHHGPEETPANWLGEKWTGQENSEDNAGDVTENNLEAEADSGEQSGSEAIDTSEGGEESVDTSVDISGDESGDESGGVSGGGGESNEAEAA